MNSNNQLVTELKRQLKALGDQVYSAPLYADLTLHKEMIQCIRGQLDELEPGWSEAYYGGE